MIKMKNSLIFIITAILYFSCTKDTENELDVVQTKHESFIYKNPVIKLKTYRLSYNMLSEDIEKYMAKGKYISTRTANSQNTFEEEKSTNEIIVLSEYASKIWLGNVLSCNSIVQGEFKPINGKKTPIRISLTLPGTSSSIIEKPSFSRYNQYIKKEEINGDFSQNGEFTYSIEQFTSYDELKMAFGYNTNNRFLFWGDNNNTQREDHKVSKATGLYIKFFQKSFTANMDYPSTKYALVPTEMEDSAIYINSITYGQLGILALETNFSADYAKENISKCFHKIFSNKHTNFTQEETRFLNSCEFKVLLLNGGNTTFTQSFSGVEGFIEHIKRNEFSTQNPGTPIFCSFARLADNTPLYIKFKYTINKEPLYIDIVDHKTGEFAHDYSIYFYSDKKRTPAIAPPNIKFNFEKRIKYEDPDIRFRDTTFIETFQNFDSNKKNQACKFVEKKDFFTFSGRSRDGFEFDRNTSYINETLLDSKDYKLLKIWTIQDGIIPDSIAYLFDKKNNETSTEFLQNDQYSIYRKKFGEGRERGNKERHSFFGNQRRESFDPIFNVNNNRNSNKSVFGGHR